MARRPGAGLEAWAEGGLERGAGRELRGFRTFDAEVHEVVIGVEAHVAVRLESGRDGSADARVVCGRLDRPGGDVGDEPGEIDFEDLFEAGSLASAAAG
jgi:hypothetical protein